MSAITYTVGAISYEIAKQIMAKLTETQIIAKLAPTDDAQRATIEVALFDRPELDRLLEPYEAILREQDTGHSEQEGSQLRAGKAGPL
jgi:hypothetical protein